MTVLLSNSNDHPIPDCTLRANSLAQLTTAIFAFTYSFHNLIAYIYPPPRGYFSSQSHVLNQSFGGGWSAQIMKAECILNLIKPVHPQQHQQGLFPKRD